MITQARPFTSLKGAQHITLTTFSKSGEAVATPLWFAEHEGVLYTQTFPSAGKLKRIRHTSRVMVAPCTFRGKVQGPQIEAEARIVTDEQEMLLAEVSLALKYGLVRGIYFVALGFLNKLRRQAPAGRTYIAIEPSVSAHYVPSSHIPSHSRNIPRSHMSIVPLFFNW